MNYLFNPITKIITFSVSILYYKRRATFGVDSYLKLAHTFTYRPVLQPLTHHKFITAIDHLNG